MSWRHGDGQFGSSLNASAGQICRGGSNWSASDRKLTSACSQGVSLVSPVQSPVLFWFLARTLFLQLLGNYLHDA